MIANILVVHMLWLFLYMQTYLKVWMCVRECVRLYLYTRMFVWVYAGVSVFIFFICLFVCMYILWVYDCLCLSVYLSSRARVYIFPNSQDEWTIRAFYIFKDLIAMETFPLVVFRPFSAIVVRFNLILRNMNKLMTMFLRFLWLFYKNFDNLGQAFILICP